MLVIVVLRRTVCDEGLYVRLVGAVELNVDSVNVVVAVQPIADVAATVYVVAADKIVGVPLMAPVVELIDNPVGNAGLIL